MAAHFKCNGHCAHRPKRELNLLINMISITRIDILHGIRAFQIVLPAH